jgi:TetR/AcrR family transcriptional regulator, cholesterol catabolism regulator
MSAAATRELRELELQKQARFFFSSRGYEAASVQDIADALGITRPLFYYYFQSKEELLWRIIGELGDELLAQAREVIDADAAPVVILEKIIRLHAAALLSNSEAFKIYFVERHTLTEERELAIRQGEVEYLGTIADVVTAAQRAGDIRGGDPQVLALLMTGLANSVLRWYSPEGDLGQDELCELIAQAAITGFLEPSRSRRSGGAS